MLHLSILVLSVFNDKYVILKFCFGRLKVVSLLNEKQVFEDIFDVRDHVQNVWRDPKKGNIWINAKRGVYKYKIVSEARFVCIRTLHCRYVYIRV